jgi:hypothetical protein
LTLPPEPGFGHSFLPHTQGTVLACCAIFAIAFAVVSVAVSFATEGKFQLWYTIAQFGSGAMAPIFVMLACSPFDQDLKAPLYGEPLTLVFGGILGVGVSVYALFFSNDRSAKNPYERHR